MITANVRVPSPVNEPVKSYAPGQPERAQLKAALQQVGTECVDIPSFIDGREVRAEQTFEVRSPFKHAHVLARGHHTSAQWVERAIDAAMKVKRDWANLAFTERAAIFLRAAELLATKYRATINAVTMWGQAKTAHQAEIDAVCESVDFLRFNVAFAQQLHDTQPSSSVGVWNQTDYRPLDGFVLAIAPFNFTAIALNLATAPALMGNVVLFKPAETASLSSWVLMQVLREAGLPDGVINFLPGAGAPHQHGGRRAPRLRRPALHRFHGDLQPPVEAGGRPPWALPAVPAPGG
jgi:1-pyrroline-5-carboxylate dehydrogenase